MAYPSSQIADPDNPYWNGALSPTGYAAQQQLNQPSYIPTSGLPQTTTGLGAQSYNGQGAPVYGGNQLSPSFAWNNPAGAAMQALARAGGSTNLENPWVSMISKYAEGLPLLAKLNSGSANAMDTILPYISDYVGALRSPLEWGGTPGVGNVLYNYDEVSDVFKGAMAGTLAPGAQELFANQDWGTMAQTIGNFLQTVGQTAIDPFTMRAMMQDLQQKGLDYSQYMEYGADGVTPAGAFDWLKNTGFLQRWLGV